MGCSSSVEPIESVYVKQVTTIYITSKNLQQIKSKMKVLLNNFYNTFKKEATEYYNLRTVYNKCMMKQGDKMIDSMKKLVADNNIDAEFIMTSSLNANINLIDESDIDISMIVRDLDKTKIDYIFDVLTANGFKYVKLVNPLQMNNYYYSYVIIKDNIEFEIKVRDKASSHIILNLHKYMETKMSDKEKKAITYAKLVFKHITENAQNITEDQIYKVFKKLVYEMYFADIEGSFMLDLI